MRDQPITPRPSSLLRRRVDRRQVLRGGAMLGLGVPAMASLLRASVTLGAEESVVVGTQEVIVPPDAEGRPQFSLPLQLSDDPYRWLENPDDPEVIAYLKAENTYSAAMLAPTQDLQEILYRELTERTNRTDTSVPTPWHGYLYYWRIEEDNDYGILCRKRGSMDAPEQILLDLNAMAVNYIALSTWRPSPDNRYLAYDIDKTGNEIYQHFIMDMDSGQVTTELPTGWNAEWAQDSRTLYYIRRDHVHGREQLARHTIGTDPATDALLYQEHDENFWLSIYPAKDGTYLFLESSTFDTNQVRAIPLAQSTAGLQVITPRSEGVRHYLEHHGDEFLILTDEDAPNFKLMAALEDDPNHGNWREVIPHRTDMVIDPYGVEPFARHYVIYGREDGFTRIWVRDVANPAMRPIEFDEAIYVTAPVGGYAGGDNWTFETDKVRIWYSSLVTPDSVYEVDMTTGDRTLLKQSEIVGDYDPGRYVTERLWATAPDGTRVPISLVSLRTPPAGLPAGPRPLRLDGYGGYGIPSDPYFSGSRLALIDRGVSYAIAHVRGGGEFGQSWWEQGRLLKKKTCFSDFIACAEHLIAEGKTAPDRLVIYGASNGGLLMGVVANERPDLFRVVVAEVPAADVVALLLVTSGGLANRDEFGDPTDPAVFAYQRSYSPYQNVTAQHYPAMFVTGGLNDNRTPYWQSAKWVAKLRDVKTDDNPLLLHVEMASGHFGVSGFEKFSRESARLYAFVLQELGIANVEPGRAAAALPPPHATKSVLQNRPARLQRSPNRGGVLPHGIA